MEDNKKGAIEFDQTTLTPFSDASKEGDMVDMIRKIMSGQPDTNGSEPQSSDTTVVKKVEAVLKAEGESDDDVEPTKTSDKLDGRTRDYRSTVSRITDGKKKKSGEGIDGRTKSYKTTMSRINTRRARKRG